MYCYLPLLQGDRSFGNDVLVTASQAATHFCCRFFPSASVLLSYIQCLLSVLMHQAKTQCSLGEITGANLAAISLSDADVLLLLGAHMALDRKRESLAEIEKLLSTCCGLQGLVPAMEGKTSRGPDGKAELETSDGTTAKILNDITNDLLRIITRWKPVRPSSTTQTLTYVWTWAMQKLESRMDMDMKLLHEVMQWIESSLLLLPDIGSEILQGKNMYLVSEILAVYGRVEEVQKQTAAGPEDGASDTGNSEQVVSGPSQSSCVTQSKRIEDIRTSAKQGILRASEIDEKDDCNIRD